MLMRGVAPTNHCTAPEECMPFTPMPSEPASEVAVLPVKGWVRRKSLDVTNKHKQMRMSI
jgi:hypothetical protein